MKKEYNLKAFLKGFELDTGCEPIETDIHLDATKPVSKAILLAIGDRSFNLGTFRTFTPKSSKHWDTVMGKTFKAFRGKISCVGFGWDGRIVAEQLVDHGDTVKGVTIFVPGTADCLNAPIDIVSFLNNELDGAEDILDAKIYLKWLKAKKQPVKYDECIGYKIPPFLSGEYEAVKNMEVSDLEVYWHLLTPLIKAYLEASMEMK